MSLTGYSGADIFDGDKFHPAATLLVRDGRVEGIATGTPACDHRITLPGGILVPGFIDLQVNGGGGHMVGGQTDAEQLGVICDAHARLGSTGILPTLITDTPEVTRRVIAAGIACREHPGFLGLHLEGPHLDPRRKGAHDASLIRPMTDEDCATLCEAARALPALMVTLAPASCSLAQIARLYAAGVVVSLGHAEATSAEAHAAFAAGARAVTHLFNAMSPLGHREPGLVGATLASDCAAGIIADGHHILPEVLRIALNARAEGLFLVTDAMAVAGTDSEEFHLNGRRVLRRAGRLELEDGTLAGADIRLPQAVAMLVQGAGTQPERALAMASSLPSKLIGAAGRGHLAPGARADFLHLSADYALQAVWRSGQRL